MASREQKIGRYTIKSEIGHGGMGMVYLAQDTRLNRLVAIKIMNAPTGDSRNFARRFIREAKTLATINHPAVVHIHEFEVENGRPYLVMEYVEGGNLNAHLRKIEGTGKTYDLRQTLKIIADAAEALAAAHRKNIIHRDIKPDNILVKKFDINNELGVQGVVTDFGLVKIVEDDNKMTALGTVLGTPDYMSPEQCLGDEVDGRTDIYSLGIVLFQAVTGILPFRSENLSMAVRNHTEVPPPQPTIYRHDLPISIVRVIERCLKKDREDRYPSAEKLARELRGIIETLGPELNAVRYFALGEVTPTPQRAERSVAQLVIEHPTKPAKTVPLDKTSFVIGREFDHEQQSVDIPLANHKVSRQHARIAYINDGWTITDLGSTNGTYLNRGKIAPDHAQPINDSTRIRIGPYRLRFIDVTKEEGEEAKPGEGPSIVIVPGGGEPLSGGSQEQGGPPPTQVLLQANPLNFGVKLEEFGGLGQNIDVKLTNRTEITEHFTLEVLSIPDNWVKLRPKEIKLNAGDSGDLKIIVKPPYSSRTKAGRHKFQIGVRARTTGTQVAALNGTITVAPFEKFSVDIHPKTIKHGRKMSLFLLNEGNGEISYNIYGKDDADELRYSHNGFNGTLESDDQIVLPITVEMRKRPWFRYIDPRAFELEVTSESTGQAISNRGTLEVKPRIARIYLYLSAFIVLFGIIWLAFLFASDRRVDNATTATAVAIAQAETSDASATVVSANETSQAQTSEARFIALTNDKITEIEIATREKQDEIATEIARAAAAAAEEEAARQAAEATIMQQTVEASADVDGDSLSFIDETTIYNTDPNKFDTDNDGLNDFDEVNRCTDPRNPDSDADELTDGDEVLRLFTNPCRADTDNDGLLDNADPQPRSTPPPTPAPIPTATPAPPTPVPPPPTAIPPTAAPPSGNSGNANSGSGNSGNDNAGSGNANAGSGNTGNAGNENANAGGGNTGNSGGNDNAGSSGNDNSSGSGTSGTPLNVNLLPNPSFEEGFSLQDNVQEYQLPDGWQLINVRDNEESIYNETYFRPEVRTLSRNNLPEDERGVFILDGDQVVKIFKGGAPMRSSFVTAAPLSLSAGEYALRVGIYADIVAHYNDGNKQFATDPNSAQVRLVLGNQETRFSKVIMGGDHANYLTFTFTVPSNFNGQVGLELDAPLLQANNGWFLDDWSLTRTK